MNNKLFYIYRLNMPQVRLNPEDKNEISDIKLKKSSVRWVDLSDSDSD